MEHRNNEIRISFTTPEREVVRLTAIRGPVVDLEPVNAHVSFCYDL